MLPLAKIRYLKSHQELRSGELCQILQPGWSCSPEQVLAGKGSPVPGLRIIIHISLRVIPLLLAANLPSVPLFLHFHDAGFFLSVWTDSFVQDSLQEGRFLSQTLSHSPVNMRACPGIDKKIFNRPFLTYLSLRHCCKTQQEPAGALCKVCPRMTQIRPTWTFCTRC